MQRAQNLKPRPTLKHSSGRYCQVTVEGWVKRLKNSESVFSQDVTIHLEFTKSIECKGKIALKNGRMRYNVFSHVQ